MKITRIRHGQRMSSVVIAEGNMSSYGAATIERTFSVSMQNYQAKNQETYRIEWTNEEFEGLVKARNNIRTNAPIDGYSQAHGGMSPFSTAVMENRATASKIKDMSDAELTGVLAVLQFAAKGKVPAHVSEDAKRAMSILSGEIR